MAMSKETWLEANDSMEELKVFIDNHGGINSQSLSTIYLYIEICIGVICPEKRNNRQVKKTVLEIRNFLNPTQGRRNNNE